MSDLPRMGKAELLLAKLAVSACIVCPAIFPIKVMRRLNRVSLSCHELKAVLDVVRRRAPCGFLVFGLGCDTALWARANRGGETVFVEDDEKWFRLVTGWHPHVMAYMTAYGTRRSQWRELLDSPAAFELDLPADVAQRQWDVILVDGPDGYHDAAPGRMKSIALASRFAAAGADMFVHDCDREVERACCGKFLRSYDLVGEVQRMRHYHVPPRAKEPQGCLRA